MNRKTLLLSCLAWSLSICFICPPLFAAQPYKPVKKGAVPNVQMAAPSLKITGVTYAGAGRSGQTFRWVATVANTGNVLIKKDQFVIKGTQLYRSGNLSCDAGTGRFPADLPPGKKATVVGSYDYKMSHKIKLDIVAKNGVRNQPVSTRTVTGPRLKADFTEFSINPTTRKWTATIRNTSTVPARFNLRVYAEEANRTTHGLGNKNTSKLAAGTTQTFTGPLGSYQSGWKVTGSIGLEGQYCDGNDVRATIRQRTLQ